MYQRVTFGRCEAALQTLCSLTITHMPGRSGDELYSLKKNKKPFKRKKVKRIVNLGLTATTF